LFGTSRGVNEPRTNPSLPLARESSPKLALVASGPRFQLSFGMEKLSGGRSRYFAGVRMKSLILKFGSVNAFNCAGPI
jgi:hypothetical protein